MPWRAAISPTSAIIAFISSALGSASGAGGSVRACAGSLISVTIFSKPPESRKEHPAALGADGVAVRDVARSVEVVTDAGLDRLILQGDSTAQAAEHLVVSPHTIQQHLKSIFEKTGVRSRRDLVGKVFFSHYEPRLRDNEDRMAVGKPLRGGPFPS